MATQKQVFTEITESIDRCNHTLPGLIQFLKNGFQKLENASGGGGGGSTVEWTQIQATGTKIAEIDIDGDKTSVYAPTGATPTISVNAEDVAYSNTVSGLTADNCQEAIDELKSLIPGTSGSVSVTADGTKNNKQLLEELYALVDSSKLTAKSVLSYNGMYFAPLAIKTPSALTFSFVNSGASSAVNYTFIVGTTSHFYTGTFATTNSFSNNDSAVTASGSPITIYY